MKPGECRVEVFARDGGCMAITIDWRAGPCRDKYGAVVQVVPIEEMEMDYVRLRSVGKRHEDPRDHVTLCPGHHRGTGAQQGYIWATSHRPQMREWLEEKA